LLRAENINIDVCECGVAPDGVHAPEKGAWNVQKREEYLRHAAECRTLAKQMEQGEHRDQLLKMAQTWEVLAEERERTRRSRGDEEPEIVLEETRTEGPARLREPTAR
jgi:hypothetical protein